MKFKITVNKDGFDHVEVLPTRDGTVEGVSMFVPDAREVPDEEWVTLRAKALLRQIERLQAR